MISTKTVFILGAGASIPYKFLSGPGLRERLVFHAEQQNSEIAENLQRYLGIDPVDMRKFLRTFQRSNIISIDAFLAKRQEFSELGKSAIAYELCAREDEYNIFRRDNDDHWYELLWNKLITDVDKPPQLINNTVRFVTFNYDRSLEFFLYESTKHTFGLSNCEAMKLSSNLPILHVYGMLGRFHYDLAVDARQYVNSLDCGQLTAAVRGIKVIPETRNDDKDFLLARNWMTEAERIIFLGFGFDPLNCHRLGLRDILEFKRKEGKPAPLMFVTTFDKTPAEINAAVAMMCPNNGWQTSPTMNRIALRNWGVLN